MSHNPHDYAAARRAAGQLRQAAASSLLSAAWARISTVTHPRATQDTPRPERPLTPCVRPRALAC